MDLHLELAEHGGSLRVRLERALREAVRSGRLPPGARLPPSRALCAQLGVSRGVVVDAYAQLAAEGYLQARRGAGTLVAPAVAAPTARTDARATALAVRHDLNPFRPALDAFPRAAWLSALTKALKSMPDERLAYPDPAGVEELRCALAAYLARARGLQTAPERIVVTGGTRQSLSLTWEALAGAGVRRVAFERPGWSGVTETVRDARLEPVAVAVDGHGLVVEHLQPAGVDAVAVTPAHHYPTGSVLAPGRRQDLIEWARSRGAVIVEDDYDAEYRYDRQPIGSLQGLEPELVVHCGSTSKTLAPAVRVGWMAVPQQLVEPLAERQRRRGSGPTPLHQLALADLIERGELDRHLRRQRRRYAHRREALLRALANRLPESQVSGAAAGLFLVLRLPEEVDERAVLSAARARGIALEGVGAELPALVLGYANLTDDGVDAAVRALAESVRAADQEASGTRRARPAKLPTSTPITVTR